MNIKKKWPSEHLRVSSLVLALSNYTPEGWHSRLFKHNCAWLCSVECGKKITTWNRRNMGTSAVKDFCSPFSYVWHRFVLLKPLLIQMMLWIIEGLDNPLVQKFPTFSVVLLKPSIVCRSYFTICEKSKHLPFFSYLIFFFNLCSWK